MVTIRHPKDFYSGLLFMGFGVFALVAGSEYTLGTAARMGPGYFPRILGILLLFLGGVLLLRSLRLNGPAVPAFSWRPTLIVLLSVLGFGVVLSRLGLVLSTIVLILAASTASEEFRWKEALLSGVAFALLTVLVFVVALKLQLPVWPSLLSGY